LFFDLIKKLLTYSPIKRLTAYEALSHQYFDPLRENGSGDRGLDLVLFSFTDEERIACGNGLIERLIPSWFENK
jgi:serine/threonine protein kinase